jgi:hypothetical protein
VAQIQGGDVAGELVSNSTCHAIPIPDNNSLISLSEFISCRAVTLIQLRFCKILAGDIALMQ